jgi:hypothetical protein
MARATRKELWQAVPTTRSVPIASSCKNRIRSVNQSVERQVVKVVNPGQAYSLGPAWELLDSAQRTLLNNQPRTLKTDAKKDSSLRRVFPAVLPQLKPNGANVR